MEWLAPPFTKSFEILLLRAAVTKCNQLPTAMRDQDEAVIASNGRQVWVCAEPHLIKHTSSSSSLHRLDYLLTDSSYLTFLH
jgi:Zn-finger protein